MVDEDRIPTRREPPPFRRVSVSSVEDLGQRMRRVVLGGPELEGLEITEPAASVRLLFPPPGADTIVMPTWTGNQFELSNGDRAPIRTFTPRHMDAEARELTVDFVVHGSGAASDWVSGASQGSEIAVSGPGRGYEVDPSSAHLLAGDETAIPAMSQLLEVLPQDVSVTVHVEIAEVSGRVDLPSHAGATVSWHELAEDAQPGDALLKAIESTGHLPGAIWIAGEAAGAQRIRKHLFDMRGLSRSDATVRGYWKKGRSAT
jgi:NADPH-dependent ferric siderophore reductase